jgi:hypothetical protein
MDNQGLISVGPLWRYWPLAILAVGIIKVAFARSRAEQGNGLWLMVIGFWLAVSVLHWWDLSFEETWPAVFIAFGISTLWKGLPRKSTPQSLEG